MPWLRLTLELVTPCFLAGAAGKEATVEELQEEGLRPASLIGQWRYWLRAALAASDPHNSKWQQREAKLFGSQLQGEGQGRVHLRPRHNSFRVVKAGSPLAELTQRARYPKFSAGRAPIDPLAYLLGQGLVHFNRGLERAAFEAGQSFDVEVTIRGKEDVVAAWKDLRRALWLWQTFGGLGARSRRGWGSVRIAGLVNPEAIPGDEGAIWQEWFGAPVAWTAESRRAFQFRVMEAADVKGSRGDELVLNGAGTDPEAPETARTALGETEFSHFGAFCAVAPLLTSDGWAAALAEAGLAMLAVRSNVHDRHRPPTDLRVLDHDAVHGMLYDRRPLQQAPHRAAFGLPHNYFFPRRGNREQKFAQFEGAQPTKTRRASPLLLTVIRVADPTGQRPAFVPLALWLKARLVDGNIREARGHATIPPPDWSAVVEFLREFANPTT